MDLSILIPSRNEQFLKNTVEDILKNKRGNTEIIVVLDGDWPTEPLPIHPDLHVIYHPQSIGQRAATNEAAKLSKAKYLMKVDAHCAFDEGFDIKLISHMQDDVTIAPLMRNLHVFNWKCSKCGKEVYQGPKPTSCQFCDNKTEFEMVILWLAKKSPESTSYCFDPTPHFQYFNSFRKRPEGQGEITESMSLQGSCFMLTREKYFELNICDERLGSWGSQGIEVACKTWLSGGRVLIDHTTWYAHLFRTQEGFGFPYPQSNSQVERAKKETRELFFNSKWEKQIRPLSWLVKKFWPVDHWTDQDLQELLELEGNKKVIIETVREEVKVEDTKSKGIIYYTDNRLDDKIMNRVQKNLIKIGLPILSCSLKPIDFGTNIVLPFERGYLTMFKQILTALININAEFVYFCEHDVLYHPTHFSFTPTSDKTFFYNTNSLIIKTSDRKTVYYDHRSLNGLCVNREAAIIHYLERISKVEKEGFNYKMGFEPFTHGRIDWKYKYEIADFKSEFPNLDLKHNNNLTPARWSPDQFRDKRNCKNWKELDINEEIQGWNTTPSNLDLT